MMRRAVHCAVLIVAIVGVMPQSRAAIVWPGEIARVERDLQAADVVQRRAAANRLTELPAATVERLLPAAFADADPEVRLLAAAGARVMGATWSPPRSARITDWLRDGDWRLRHAAAELLTRAPDATAIVDLVRSLGDSETAVRAQVVQALLATGSSEVVLPLLGRIDDPDPAVREQILLGLSLLGDERAVLPLLGKLQDQRPNVRAGAARALGRLGDARAVAPLLLAFADSDDEVKVAVIDALGRLQAESAAQTLVAALRTNPSEVVNQALLSALVRLKSSTAAAAVILAVTSEDDQQAQLAQGAMRDASDVVIELLQVCVANQSNESIANDCTRALAQVPKARAAFGDGRLLLDALQQGSISKAVALEVLERLELPAALPQVLALLDDQDPQLRSQAAALAGRLLDPEHPDGTAIDPLLRALERAHGSPRLQQSLLVALGHTASPRASAALLPYLNAAQRPALRLAAIDACGLVAGEGTSSALLALLDDGDGQIRLAAALALRRLRDATTFEPLWQRLTVAPSQDREAIAVALGGALRAPLPPAKLEKLAQRVLASRPTLRDVLLESLRFLPADRGMPLLAQLGQHSDVATRSKIAEVVAGYGPPSAALLKGWVAGIDNNLRANVAWTLGSAGAGSVMALLTLVQDPDHAVAGNAVASLARVHPDATELASQLCGLTADPRAYVRANALTGLGLRAQRCSQGIERRLLAGDRSKSVRLAAARLLVNVPGDDARQDRIALGRCRDREIDPEVAQVCTTVATPSPVTTAAGASEPRTVFVLPRGGGEPLPGAPFAFVTTAGFIRSGWTDHRGAFFERGETPVRLAVAPQFVTIE